MGAVRVAEVSGDIVFDFDVVIAAELAEAGDLVGHAEEPLIEVEVMGALVEEDAAAFAFPCGAPAAGSVVGFGAEPVGAVPEDAADGAEFAVGDETLDLLVDGVGAELEHGAEDLLGALVGGDETFAVGFVDGEGFFDHDMEAGVERGDAHGGVEVVRGGDEDGVDGAGLEHGVEVRELGFAGDGIGEGFCAVADGSKGEPFDFAGADAGAVSASHVAESDESDAYSLHGERG